MSTSSSDPTPPAAAGGTCSSLDNARLSGVLRASTRISIISTNTSGIIQVFNSGAENITGYSAEEVVGRCTPERLHLPEEVEEYGRELTLRLGRRIQGFESFVALALQGGPEGYDARQWTYVRKDGGHVLMDLVVTAIYNEAGEHEGFLGVGVDLTERNRLRSRLDRALVSVDNAGDMIFWVEADTGRHSFANDTACHLLGYTRPELLGMDVYGLYTHAPVKWRERMDLLRRDGSAFWDAEFHGKTGQVCQVEVSATLIQHKGREYCLCVVRDVTRRKALEADLRQAQASLDSAGDMIFWTRADNRVLAYVNKAACEGLGYTRDELTGMLLERVNPLRTEKNWAKLLGHLAKVGRTTYEANFMRKGGEPLPVEVAVSLSEQNGEAFVISIVRDISERKRIQARMERQLRLNSALASIARTLIDPAATPEHTANLLLEHALALTESTHGLVAAVRIGPEGREEMVVHAATAMMPGKPLTSGAHSGLFTMGSSGRYPGLWGYALNNGEAYFDNAAGGHPSARGVPPTHEPIRRILGAPAKVGATLAGQLLLANPSRDYTADDLVVVQALADLYALGLDQQRAQRELVRARDEAQTANRAKGEFLSNMTHEVRTPLNGVLGMLQVLEGSGLTDEQREYAAIALGSAEHLARLLNNVLEYARLENAASSNQQDCAAFPPTDLLQSLRAVYEPQARAKGLAFHILAGASLPELVDADHALVRQALVQLLDNAIKFTVAGEVRLEASSVVAEQGKTNQPVVVAALPGQGTMIFRVVDTGIGVPQAMRQRVFGAFVQADASITRQYGGAGLGLAIASRLATLLRGSLRLEDNPGGGTVMILTLPTHCLPAPREKY